MITFDALPACPSRDRDCRVCTNARCLDVARGPAHGHAEAEVDGAGTLSNVFRVRPEDCRRCVDSPTAVAAPMAPVVAPSPRPSPSAVALRPPLGPLDYVSTARLVADTRVLINHLPPDVDLVVAISRSGLLPGSLVAYHLHVPLMTVSRQTGLLNPGHGIRLENRPTTRVGHVLLIDDTVAGGREMTANAPAIRTAYPNAKLTRAVIYAHPLGQHAVDLYVSEYPGGHYLEWNWCNAGHGSACGFDMDGILCRDFTPEECSSDAQYRETMARIEPLFLPRRLPIPLIVTARPESTRGLTLDWLARHGLSVESLVMRDFEIDPARGWTTHIAEYKAWHYARSSCILFAESEPDQAAIIAVRSGKPVLCPAAERVFAATD